MLSPLFNVYLFIYVFTFERRGESAETGVFRDGESGGDGDSGGIGDKEALVHTDIISSLRK